MAQGSDSIVNKKRDALAAYAEAKAALLKAQQNIATGVQQLNTLFNQAVALASENQQRMEAQVDNGIMATILSIVIGAAVGSLIAVTVVRNITGPLKQINEMLQVVASGDLTRRLKDDAENEFGELARNCNSLIDSLRNLIQGIIARSTQLAAASEETSAITTETTQAIQDQRSQMEQAATATTEMSSTSQSVMHSADEALHEIKHADSRVPAGQRYFQPQQAHHQPIGRRSARKRPRSSTSSIATAPP